MKIRLTTTYDFVDDAGGLDYLRTLVQRGVAIPVEDFLRTGVWEFSSTNEVGDKATTQYEIVRKRK